MVIVRMKFAVCWKARLAPSSAQVLAASQAALAQ
jgi:hypothetical protein